MKKTISLIGILIWTSSVLTAGPIAKAVVLDNNGNPTKSIANKAVKVKVADDIIDPTDTAVQKVVKAKAVRGDYRTKRKIRRETR